MNIEIPAPVWITDQIEHMLKDTASRLPRDFHFQTVEGEFGIEILVDTKRFDQFTVNERIDIATKLNAVVEKIRETGCYAWVTKG